MSDERFQIQPFVGFGRVRLGMTRESVSALLGEPSEKAKSTDGWEQEHWRYDELGVQLDFSAEESFVLGGVSFQRPQFAVAGCYPVGASESELLALGRTGALPELALEEDFADLGSKNYECESLGLSFWVSGEVVTRMSMFPKYDESGNRPLWPSANS